MLKNTQSKIISIICITQIILITLVGVASYKATNKANVLIFIAVGILATIIIEMYIYKYISKYVMYPVNKLIESAEEIKVEEMNIIVPSLRLDNFVSDLARTSRSKAVQIIDSERVFINGQNETKASKQVKLGDVITIRGKGRFVV